MIKSSIMLVFTIMMIIMGCGGGIELSFKEPTQTDTMLVIGRVLLEIGTTLNAGIHHDEMSVAIVGETEKGKTIGYWTRTDPEGYYAFANVPKGRYMVKTIKATVRDLGLVTITSRLTGGNNFYYYKGRVG